MRADHSRDNGTSRDINRARPAPPSRRPRPAKVPLPERWEPSLDDCKWLKREFCIGDNEIDIAAEQFREHARRAGMCPTIGGASSAIGARNDTEMTTTTTRGRRIDDGDSFDVNFKHARGQETKNEQTSIDRGQRRSL